MPVFKLRLGASIPRSVGLSVCRSVGLSVCRSVCLSSKNYKKNYKTLQNIPKTLQNICKDRQGNYYDITKCYKTLQNRLPREMNSLHKTPSTRFSLNALVINESYISNEIAEHWKNLPK